MEITKYDMVMTILEMYDELTSMAQQINRLDRENQDLRRKLHSANGSADLFTDGLEHIEAKVLRLGRERFFSDHTYGWNTISLHKNEDGTYEPQPFEKWRKETVRNIPDDICMDDFYEYFDAEFRENYDRDVHDAMERQIANDRQGKEDDE